MEVKVIITHELGESTVNLLKSLAGIANGNAAKMTVVKEAETVKGDAKAAPAEKAKPGPKGKAAIASDAFAGLDADDQLEAIKGEVTKHSKRGKTADMKEIIGHFGAARASEIDPTHYADAYAVLIAYGNGASVADALASAGGEAEEGDDLL